MKITYHWLNIAKILTSITTGSLLFAGVTHLLSLPLYVTGLLAVLVGVGLALWSANRWPMVSLEDDQESF